MKNMLNFTIGPVMTWNDILNIGGEQVPYFRTTEFSSLMKDNEDMMLRYSVAPNGSRCAFLTGSGTMGMEAAVINFLSKDDRALVVNGGNFGHRFVELCELHGVTFDEIKLEMGCGIDREVLDCYEGKGYTSILINMHETSTGVLYDMDLVAEFSKRNNLLLIVDAISAFMADPVNMEKWGVDVMITSSQKAFACAPGISMLTISPRAIARMSNIDSGNLYMDVESALKNGDRGQTPFTPAVLTLLQINKRLHMVASRGGMSGECDKVAAIARYFRESIKELPIENISCSLSNAVTALHPTNGMSAKTICDRMKDEFGIWICPNGGDMTDYMFRVGHIGNISMENINILVHGLKECLKGK